MTNTTLCYIEKDGCYLMLHRVKKQHDLNKGKWIGVGGHIEPDETAEECIRRETREETGLILEHVTLRGVIEFISDRWENEHMYLYTSDGFSGELTECNEGVLRWIPKSEVFDLNLWEGDRVFLNYLIAEEPFFHLELDYDERDELKKAELLPKLILASASPRRRELLEQVNILPVVLPSAVKERMEGATPEEIVKNLSKQKAEDVEKRFSDIFHNGEVILGADTIVVADGEILGKPHTHEEAAEMIRRIQGRVHQVYTGVTLIRCGSVGKTEEEEQADSGHAKERVTFAERTDVYVAPMTEEEIIGYASGEEPMDKAGAYGIQGTFAAFIEKIDGDYTTVVGLPLGAVCRHLKLLTAAD